MLTLFYYLESEHMLDPLNEIHLYCLHTVFIPRIKDQTNNHPMRTERNMSPYQMFISGMLANNDSRRQLLLDANIEPRHFGVDEDRASAATDDEESQVICDPPRLPFILTDSQQE